MATVAPGREGERRAQGEGERQGEGHGELHELARSFKRLLRSVHRLRGRDTHLAEGEVTHAQFELLVELYDRGPLPVGELAAAAQLTPATVTQMLDHLQAGNHVERVRSDADRRVVVAALTKSGRRKVSDKRAAWQSRWEKALAGTSHEELAAARRVLDRLGSMFDDTASGSCGRD
ncbi:MAG: MarR family winged helix-turn-helix transcriptional regulator [Solirubrobacteraceae bacterium]